MRRQTLSMGIAAATLLIVSAGAFAEEASLATAYSSDQFVSIQLPSIEWTEQSGGKEVVFTDGDNEIQVEVYKRTDKIPTVTLADDEFEVVYESYFSNKQYVVVTTGYVVDEADYSAIKKSVDSIKLDMSLAEKHIAASAVSTSDAGKETEKTTEQTADSTATQRTGNVSIITDANGNSVTVYECADGYWRDDNGRQYSSALNQDGYFRDEAGVAYQAASDRGENTPDYLVYGADGMVRELYDNGDGTATDAYGNPYQVGSGDEGFIDYYGNHYYEGAYRSDYERNDYTMEDSGENGVIYTNSEYITSVDGETRLVYWQNEFYAIDEYGNEYIYSGMDGSLTSSDGLSF